MKRIEANIPLYKAVQDELMGLISTWDHSKPIPSETRLSEELGVSRSTVREALQRLERAEIVYKKHGVGTFVGRQANLVATALNDIRGVQNIIRASGRTFSLKRHLVEAVSLPERIAEVFSAPAGTQTVKVTHVYLADGAPTLLGTSYVAPALMGGAVDSFDANRELLRTCGERGDTLFDILEQHFATRVRYAVTRIRATKARSAVAEDLDIAPSKAVVQLDQIHYDERNHAVLFSEDLVDTDVFELIVLRRSVL